MIKVSVIIPVFNAHMHLHKCIESLLSQTLEDCEFIFVNDGSTDDSVSIIQQYQINEPRIQLYNQENKGVSSARNKGIQLAKGDYIGFVDADDYVENTMFQELYDCAIKQKVDIVIANYFKVVDGKSFPILSKFSADTTFTKAEINETIIPEFIKGSALNSCCNKLYKSSRIKNIHFPNGIPLGEDGIFNLQAFNSAERVFFLNYFGYHYQEVAGSATRSSAIKNYFKRALEVYKMDYQVFVSFDLDPEKVAEWKSIRLLNNVISYIHIYLQSKGEFTFFDAIKSVKDMIAHPIVQESVHKYYTEIRIGQNKYKQFILHCIKNKSLIQLILVHKYFQIRNK